MKKIIILLFGMIMPLFMKAQTDGVKFSSAQSWAQVLAEAKAVNKYIFLDIYATWCVPCKMMDREVYTKKEVGDFVNANFIAVKVQADSSMQDNDFIKGWYKDAAYLKGWASAYPTFAFFDPNGKYSGREMGFYKSEDFILMLKKTVDPKGSYLAQVQMFEKGALTKTQISKLAIWAKDIKDDSTALKVAIEYKRRFIDNVPLDSVLNPEEHKFISRFLEIFTFKDEVIKYMYKHPTEANKKFAAWEKYAVNASELIIVQDYIFAVTKPNNINTTAIPDWKKIEKNITRSFDKQTAKRLVLDAKIWRANEMKNWDDAAKYQFEKMDNYGMDTVGLARAMLNNFVYSVVFTHVKDTVLLKKAVEVMRRVVEADNYSSQERLDTYASVLYKAGNKRRAIEVEQMALNLAINKKNHANIKFYEEMIDKMNRGVIIWNEK